MGQIFRQNVSDIQLYIYNIACISALLYLLFRYRRMGLMCLIIFLFFEGVFSDLLGSVGKNIFKLTSLAICLWKANNGYLSYFLSKFPKITLMLIIYSLYFVFSSIIICGDNYMTAFSQLTKIIIPWMIVCIIMKETQFDRDKLVDYFWVFEDIIICQIVLCVVKVVILGGFLEGWVGSITGIAGGGLGTSLPVIALVWMALKNDMKFTSRDWLMAFGLLFVGFSTGKRAVWLLFPSVFILLSTYVYHTKIMRKLLVVILCIPLFFYFGLRLTPTFNPENKVWGSFDPEYAINYTLKYSGGIDEKHSSIQKGQGRLGAVLWLQEQFNTKNIQSKIFGKGLEYYMDDGSNYFNSNYWDGINGKGAITGIVRTYMSNGFIGVVLLLILISTILLNVTSRYNIMLYGFVLFDYVFYNATSINSMQLLCFVMFLSLFSRFLSDNNLSDTTKNSMAII